MVSISLPQLSRQFFLIDFIGIIVLDPNYGTVLGGSSVIVTGDQLLVSEEDDVFCRFDATQTRGVYVSQNKVLCISPTLDRTGKVDFRLQVTRNSRNFFTAESTYTSRRLSHALLGG